MSVVPPVSTVKFLHQSPPSSPSNPTPPRFPSKCHAARSLTPKALLGNTRPQTHRHPLPFASPSDLLPLASAVGSPPSLAPLTRWTLESRHVLLLNLTACAVALSASWVFFSAIPTLMAFRRAAESVEKLLDAAAEELPDTMAAVRLSGMEISDLTMELSDLGQELTQGVRSSTRAVRVVEDRLRRLTTMPPTASVQGQVNLKNEMEGPMLAKSAKNLREGIVKGRVVFGAIFSFTQISRWVWNFLAARGQKRLS